ncbi:MAG: DNA primase [Clostridia bacterium]|nr:DNA primase [Clostridia bacterium]
MARFPDSWMGELLSKSDIASIASEYTQLKPKGKRLWGCCPFHSEKTPSFSVSPDTQLYYCFGCHAGGSVVQFVMEMEKLTYIDAIKYLAQRAGMELPEEVDDDRLRRERAIKERLYAACKAAAMFYHEKLMSPEGKAAQQYLAKRGIDGAIAKKFGLGYAPAGWDNLLKHLTGQGFKKEELISAGLAVKGNREGSCYDAYRDRIIFPIINTYKRVLGFGARTMGDDIPKYLNTGDTPIFNKRNNLYAINLQKGQHNADLIMVEGYMDVISLYKAGVKNAVASLGTALTQQQARLIKRFVPRVYISYDGDSAGQNATLRGLDILSKEGLEVRVIVIPDGMDPDDYARRYGGEEYLSLKDKAITLNAFKLDSLMNGLDLNTADGREEYAKKACALLSELQPVEQERYIPAVSRRTGLSAETIRRQCGIAPSVEGNSIGNNRNTKQKSREVSEGPNKAEISLLSCMIRSSDALLYAMDKMAEYGIGFSVEGLDEFAAELLALNAMEQPPNIPVMLSGMPADGAEAVSAALGLEEQISDPAAVAEGCIKTIVGAQLEDRINELACRMEQDDDTELRSEYMRLVKMRASLK